MVQRGVFPLPERRFSQKTQTWSPVVFVSIPMFIQEIRATLVKDVWGLDWV
jgi:hypothetical protein